MKGQYKEITVFAIIFLALVAAVAFADTITTSVRFIVRTDVAFSIAVPQNASFVSSGATDEIQFNTSRSTDLGVNATVWKSGLLQNQSSTAAIFLYRNDGNRDINITMALNTNATCTGGTIELKASNESTGYQNSCTKGDEVFDRPPDSGSCVNITTRQALVVANLSDTAPDNMTLWLWADFNACNPGLNTAVTATSNSTSSGAS